MANKTVLLIFLLISWWRIAPAHAEEKCTQIVYSTNPYYPPYDWVNPEGHFEGASIDLLQRVAPKGVKLVEAVYPWKRALAVAGKGEVDLLLSLRITPEREKAFLFTTHRAFPNPIVAYVRMDSSISFKGWADLKGLYGAISAGDTFGSGFDEYLRSNLRFEEGYTLVENFRKLSLGRVDYYVSGRYLGDAYLAQTGLGQRIKALSPPLSNGDIHFAFSRNSPCVSYLNEISERLHTLDESGENIRLLTKHVDRFRRGEIGNVFVTPP